MGRVTIPLYKQNYPLKELTTMKIGGPAKYFYTARTQWDLIGAISWATHNKIRWYLVGEGSNMIPSDKGFNGLIVKNQIEDFIRTGNTIYVGSGSNLLAFIFTLDKLGLAGMEKMAGIPGTIGAAVYGCVGAYGQEIKDNLTRVRIYDGKKAAWVSKDQCRFNYRDSIFKKKKEWIVLGAEFEFRKQDPKELLRTSKAIIKLREKKYPPGLLCPGSFFKNIVVKNIKPASLREQFLKKVPPEKVMYGKVAAGTLLELVGAKGLACGDIEVAGHHGNLIYNLGRGNAAQVKALAKTLKAKVKKKFGIELEEEVQYV